MPEQAVITGAVRTPIGKRGKTLSDVHAAELLGSVMREALARAKVPAEEIDQALIGCVNQVGDQSYNIGRVAWLTAGLPMEVPASTIDAYCGSSQQALNIAAAMVTAGTARHVLIGGIENMSRHPLGSAVSGGDGNPLGAAYRERYEPTNQGEAAERIADRWDISRAECDEIGLRSQQLAAATWEAQGFGDEIMPVQLPGMPADRPFVRDETFRPTTLESLAALKPVFRPDGRMTPGNSSQVCDGAACVVVSAASACEELGIEPLARIAHQAFVASDPVIKLTGPIPATRKILSTSGLKASDIGHFEVNEAFASVVGAWYREIEVPLERINPRGGAIALGHPVGATGARLVTTLVHALRQDGGGRGLVTMCCGGGLGTATIIEVDG